MIRIERMMESAEEGMRVANTPAPDQRRRWQEVRRILEEIALVDGTAIPEEPEKPSAVPRWQEVRRILEEIALVDGTAIPEEPEKPSAVPQEPEKPSAVPRWQFWKKQGRNR